MKFDPKANGRIRAVGVFEKASYPPSEGSATRSTIAARTGFWEALKTRFWANRRPTERWKIQLGILCVSETLRLVKVACREESWLLHFNSWPSSKSQTILLCKHQCCNLIVRADRRWHSERKCRSLI